MSQTSTPAQAGIPADVAAFAAERGAADYLPAVQAMTQGVLPNAPISIRLEEDAEIADLWTIVFETTLGGLDVPRYLELQRQWSRELFQVCPSTHAHLFVLLLHVQEP